MHPRRIAGIIILVVGLIVLTVGVAEYAQATTNRSSNLLATNSYVVAAADNRAVGVTLNSGQTLSGTYTQINGSSVEFYFMTANQQNQFGNCAPCSSPAIVNASAPKIYNFDWAINSSGTYFLVLDNSAGSQNVAVQLTANAVGANNQAGAAIYPLALGAIVAVVGAIVLALPIRKKTNPPLVQKAQSVPSNDQSR